MTFPINSFAAPNVELDLYYLDEKLYDIEYGLIATGLQSAGTKLKLFKIFKFSYEIPKNEKQRQLSELSTDNSSMYAFQKKLSAALKPLKAISDQFDDIFIEYSRHNYLHQSNGRFVHYDNEMIFIGADSESVDTNGLIIKGGIFYYKDTQKFGKVSSLDKFGTIYGSSGGIMLGIDNIILPIGAGGKSCPIFCGIIDGIRVQYIAGGDLFIFDIDFGLKGKIGWGEWFAKIKTHAIFNNTATSQSQDPVRQTQAVSAGIKIKF